MPTLAISLDGVVLREHKLSKERTTIGRRSSSDIQIDNLSVSGEHAVVFTLINDAFVEDLNSTNGTYVNGKPVRRHLLQNGDVIEIGKHKIKYQTSNDAAGNFIPDFERTQVVRGTAALKPAESLSLSEEGDYAKTLLERPAADGLPTLDMADVPVPMRGFLRVMTGPATGRELALDRQETTIGKAGGDHAIIRREVDGHSLRAADGAPPTVNGEPLVSGARMLNNDDVIELVGIKVKFFTRSA